jgi:hypothetical protein
MRVDECGVVSREGLVAEESREGLVAEEKPSICGFEHRIFAASNPVKSAERVKTRGR